MSASMLSASTPAAGLYPVRHRWTVSDFQRLGETGLLAPDARLELIDGELFEMAPNAYWLFSRRNGRHSGSPVSASRRR